MRRMLALFTLPLFVAACDLSGGSKDGTDDGGQLWTGRHYDGNNLQWASHRNLTSQEFSEKFDEYSDLGLIIVDVDATTDGTDTVYSMVWHDNPDGREWAEHRDLTSEEYGDLWEQYRDLDWRPLDVEAYSVNGALRYAGIWIENVEGLAWSSRRNETSADYELYFDEMVEDGFLPIDIEGYSVDGELRFAGIWVENVKERPFAHYRNLDRDTYQEHVEELDADGYLMVDYESYSHSGDQYYAAVWTEPVQPRVSAVSTDRNDVEYSNIWRQRTDEGYRLADQEHDDDLYGGIWVENSDRLFFADKSTLDTLVQEYRDSSFPNVTGAVSVAVIKDGALLYTRGLGEADAALGVIAHSQTVYRLASVSKVVGGTLAAKLEAATELEDGTTYTLDLGAPTSQYLTGIPDHHTHTVAQVSAHLGCIAHYPSQTDPGISNTSERYASSLDAVEEIWDTGLVTDPDCTIGEDRVYSTPAFTFLGAALEAATDRSLHKLLDEELFAPHGLTSMRSYSASPTLPSNPLRAVSYEESGDVRAATDDSWKVLGGGLESNVRDLASFGQQVLNGDIVSADANNNVRDERLWSPVDPDCKDSTGAGTCENGIAWELRPIDGRRVAEHGGSWSGARSHLRVYRDDGLVVAVLTNRRGYFDVNGNDIRHDPSDLIDQIADVVLSP